MNKINVFHFKNALSNKTVNYNACKNISQFLDISELSLEKSNAFTIFYGVLLCINIRT